MEQRFLSLVLIFISTLVLLILSSCSRTTSDSNESDMVFVPAGTFIMGNSSKAAFGNRTPAHEIFLDAYYIDKYEVTFKEYEAFIQAGGYEKKKYWLDEGWQFIQQYQIKGFLVLGQDRVHLLNHELYNTPNQPIIGISWYEANAYCRWVDKRLPTEAEWEKAARGQKGFLYPWGNEMNFENVSYRITNGRRTVPVGSFPTGASLYGVMDMAGNVWEWCSDWYDGAYYAKSPSKNPQGPKSGAHRVLRGGGWRSTRLQLQSTYRYHDAPTYRGFNVGFRCAKNAN